MNGFAPSDGPSAAYDAILDRGAREPRGGFALDLLDPARIDVAASRVAGEPRRGPAHIRAHGIGAHGIGAHGHPGATPAPPATLLVLHDAGADGHPRWAGGTARVDVERAGHDDRVPPSAPDQPLARTDHDLACLRSAVLDLHAVLAAWPRRADERILLLASGVAAAGALVALGAGLAAGAGSEDALRHELLLDLREGDALHARIADDVASRIAAAVLIDPAGAAVDWRDVALARIATPVALVEHRGSSMARRGFATIGGADRLHARVDSASGIVGLVTSLASRPAREAFEAVAGRPPASTRPDASGIGEARHARGCPGEAWPLEICRSDFAPGLLRSVWRAATQAGLRPRWS